ncbi:MAG: FG-GAP-like repeat-containing protein [Planctomycetota bacterium]
MLKIACTALVPAVPALAQGFVDRTDDLSLRHEVATGFDGITDTAIVDWVQRGLALGDIDGDGDLDVVCTGGVLQNTVLGNAGFTFVDITEAAGIEAGELDSAPALADYDRDGDLDLYIGATEDGGYGGASEGRGRMYRNLGDGTFEDVTALAPAVGSGHTVFSQWVDADYDGYLDLFVAEFYTTTNRYYRNNGDGTFTDLTDASGLGTEGSTHATCFVDSDNDGWLDYFVGNDYFVSESAGMNPPNESDLQLQGLGWGDYLDVTLDSGADQKRGIMGIAIGDVNYDGRFDLYKTDVQANWLLINNGWPGSTSAWTRENVFYGVDGHPIPDPDSPTTNRGIGWGAVFLDADFDLWLDLFLVNGMIPGFNTGPPLYSPRDQRNFLWTGDGPSNDFRFTDSTEELGLDDEIDDRCVAVGDLDADGDLDLFIQATTGFLRYYENQVDPQGQGWLAVRPVCNTSAPGGFGVRCEFTDSLGYPHLRQIGLDGPTASQHENLAYFGLGTEASVDLSVEFPSGVRLLFPGTAPNQTVVAIEPELIRTSAATLPIAVSSTQPGTNNKPTPLQPTGVYAVTAFAHDAGGSPLDGSAAVAIETPGLTPLGDVLHLGGNEFRRYFEAPASPGAFRSEVSFDGWQVKIRPRVHFYDPSDASGTTIRVAPEGVRAGTTDRFEVTVAPKAPSGVSLGSGKSVAIHVDGLTPLAGPLDLGDGRYRALFPAPPLAGTYEIEVMYEGVEVAPHGTIEAAGPPAPIVTSYTIEVPHITTSAAPNQLKLKVTPRDAAGRRLGPRADVQLTTVPDPGAAQTTVRADLFPQGQDDGDFLFIVEKPIVAHPEDESGLLQLTVDGVDFPPQSYTF